MKAFTAILLFLLSSGGLASPGSWPNEAMMLYASHALEFIELQDTSKLTIAPGCKPASNKNKVCSMDEFLRYICVNPLNKHTDLGTSPDVNDVITQMKKAGFDTLKYDTQKVLPSQPGAAHEVVMFEAAKAIQKSAASIFAGGFENEAARRLLTQAEEARKFAQAVRTAEQAPFKVKQLAAKLLPFFVSKKVEVEVAKGMKRTYEDIDVDKTKANAKTVVGRDAIDQANKDWNAAKLGSAKDMNHEAILRVYRAGIKTAFTAALACMPEN